MISGTGIRLILLGTLLNLLSIAFAFSLEFGPFFAVAGVFSSLFSFFYTDKYTNIKIFLLGVNLILFSIMVGIMEGSVGGVPIIASSGFIVSLFSLRKTKKTVE